MKQKYINAYMQMAEVFAQTSEAVRAKVGSLIVKDDTIISQGINGTPKGFHTNVCELPDGSTAPWTLHSEINALQKVLSTPEAVKGSTMFITLSPCRPCGEAICKAGITRVFYREQYRDTAGIDYLLENGVKVTQM